jgi:hypothetical protein
MKYFENENRVGSDTCAKHAEDKQNSKIQDYMLFNYQLVNTEKCINEDKVKEFMVDNYMHIKDGYGQANSCYIDKDSTVRYVDNVDKKQNTQLFARIFQAVPDLRKGDVNTETEDVVVQGENTFNDFECHGQPLDVFTPMLGCLQNSIQNPDHIITPWTWGGEPTRDTLNQKEFLEKDSFARKSR